jgi:hypothetical protein
MTTTKNFLRVLQVPQAPQLRREAMSIIAQIMGAILMAASELNLPRTQM